MKTDMQRFIELYASFNIPLISRKVHHEGEEVHCILLKQGAHGFNGYHMFYSDVYFSLEGKFISQGFWE